MKTISKIKSIPVIALLALGLALTSSPAMADKGERSSHKGEIAKQFSHEVNRSHRGTAKPGKRSGSRSHDRNSHKWTRKDRDHRYYKSHDGGKHRVHRGKHRHGYTGYPHTHRIVSYHDHHIGMDDLRFMVGLHTDRFDIILRD
jgi:hypothetical protein